jgi:hypothetical protein
MMHEPMNVTQKFNCCVSDSFMIGKWKENIGFYDISFCTLKVCIDTKMFHRSIICRLL